MVRQRRSNARVRCSRPWERKCSISVAEIIRALEGPIAITECLDDALSDCSIESCCPVRANWARINGAVRVALEAIPLTEMIPSFPPALAGRKG